MITNSKGNGAATTEYPASADQRAAKAFLIKYILLSPFYNVASWRQPALHQFIIECIAMAFDLSMLGGCSHLLSTAKSRIRGIVNHMFARSLSSAKVEQPCSPPNM